MRVRLKGIHTVKKRLADGSFAIYYYAWRGGPRIKAKFNTPEFFADFKEHIDGRREHKNKNVLFNLICEFKKSSEWASLSPRTKHDYTRLLKGIEDKFGTMPISGLNDKRVRAVFKTWRDEYAARSARQADYAWSVLARVLSWARDRGLIDVNPCERGGRFYKVDRRDKIWTYADELKFYECAPPHLHLALTLALWTGQRQGDLLKLTWEQYDGNYIRLQQGKTGKRVVIPCSSVLKAALNANRKEAGTILRTMDGNPWTSNGFGASWRSACKLAKITGLTFHDTRGTAVTRLAISGVDIMGIAAVTGHSTRHAQDIIEAHYLSMDIRLAESAIRRLEKDKTWKKTVNRNVNQKTGNVENSS